VVDAVLIPEVHFQLKGEKGLFKYLQGVLEAKGHCVVCVAEGAGQVRQCPCACTDPGGVASLHMCASAHDLCKNGLDGYSSDEGP
jgi:hypothetical protein